MQLRTVCLCVTSKLYAFKACQIFRRINHYSNSTEEMVVGKNFPEVIFQPADMMWYILYALYGFFNSYFPKTLWVLIPFKDKPTVMPHSILRSKGRECVNTMSNKQGGQPVTLHYWSRFSWGWSVSDLHEQCQRRISAQSTEVFSTGGKKKKK